MELSDQVKHIKNNTEKCLREVGIERGDIILVHSDSTAFRQICNLGWAEAMVLLKQCFLDVLGDSGTLIVPTFNWDFCKGRTYIHERARSQIGMFTNSVLFDKRSIRSFHPIYSFAGIGPASIDILADISKSSFGGNSVFDKLYQKNAKIVLFYLDSNVMDDNFTTTFIHYIEQKKNIDYRYIKYFKGRVSRDGEEYEDAFDYNVRYQDDPVYVDEKKIIDHLLSVKKIKMVLADNRYPISQISCRDMHDELMIMLDEDPYYLLKHPPRKHKNVV
tara:strand:- start:111 stop:935 length:825 start_codon:yes stop_codon:yes gene_type:complete